jgi:acyl-CoA synthetase (AMP-forming)/AMP-acid ligase II
MVITGGFKVPAAEVERAIMEIPAVAECAVIGVPDAQRGETVKAIVRVRAGHSLSIPLLLAHCRSRLGRTNSPARVEEWAEFPRTPVGKIDKLRIRQKFWARASREIN